MVLYFHTRISGSKQQQLKWFLPYMTAELKQMQILYQQCHHNDSCASSCPSLCLEHGGSAPAAVCHWDHRQVTCDPCRVAEGKRGPNREILLPCDQILWAARWKIRIILSYIYLLKHLRKEKSGFRPPPGTRQQRRRHRAGDGQQQHCHGHRHGSRLHPDSPDGTQGSAAHPNCPRFSSAVSL